MSDHDLIADLRRQAAQLRERAANYDKAADLIEADTATEPTAAPKKARKAKAGKEGKQRPRPTGTRSEHRQAQIARVRAMLKDDPELTCGKVESALGCSPATASRYLAAAKKGK